MFLWLLVMFNVLLLLDNAAPIPGMDGFITLAAGAEFWNGPMTDAQFSLIVEKAFMIYLLVRVLLTIALFYAMFRSFTSGVRVIPHSDDQGNPPPPSP
jgi:hypothetical protein